MPMARARTLVAAMLACLMAGAEARQGPAPVPEPVPVQADFILVDKSDRQMTLFADGRALKTYRIVLGGNPIGHKQRQGDSRTPEGRYVIDRKIPNSQFTRGLGISYPNEADRAAARRAGVDPGGAIVIHGSPDYIEPLYTIGGYVDWTDGCIALPTHQMREVYARVPVGTPIEIRP
jgi:murein L,D-transpeptidase YafK